MYLATLAQRRPDLKQELSELRTQLASETTDSLKVWKLRDLSLQATQATIDAQDPLRTLKDLSQDFPRHAAGLSARRRVRDDLREAAATAHAYSMHSGLTGRALRIFGWDCSRRRFSDVLAARAAPGHSVRSIVIAAAGGARRPHYRQRRVQQTARLNTSQ